MTIDLKKNFNRHVCRSTSTKGIYPLLCFELHRKSITENLMQKKIDFQKIILLYGKGNNLISQNDVKFNFCSVPGRGIFQALLKCDKYIKKHYGVMPLINVGRK
jgi:hypothetical protein